MNLKRTFRRSSYLCSRLVANMGVAGGSPLLERVSVPPVTSPRGGKLAWDGLFLDTPEEWDDPYRFFRW